MFLSHIDDVSLSLSLSLPLSKINKYIFRENWNRVTIKSDLKNIFKS